MKIVLSLLHLFLATFVTFPALAQSPAPIPAATPAPTPARPAPAISPEINVDRSVAFRLRAPAAQKVLLRGQWTKDPVPLTRADDGLWSFTAPPDSIPAGVWEYSFNVDGVAMIDPGNAAIKPMREPRTSILHLAAANPSPWDFQEVPHGTVHQHTYLSKALGRPRSVWVYTPPGYEKNPSAAYPLLVLQHGSGDNEQTWVAHGKAHWILDSLIAAGKARPMVVMMIDGHPFTPAATRDPANRGQAMAAFTRELLDDALPLVESVYRVSPDRAQRGIVGLSMGGGQALTVGLAHLDRFAYVGSFSGVPADEPVTQAVSGDAKGTNAKLRLLWIACGADDSLLQRNEEFVAKLKAGGVNHEWHLTPGNHSWPVWRGYLADFLPRLFRPTP
jgi:enterochelin esterase family protein